MAYPRTPEDLLMHYRPEGELPEAEQALYETLVPQNQEKAISLSEFSGLYASETIAKDESYVKDMQARFAREDRPEKNALRMRGELFEAIVNSQIAESDWMGPRADVIVPSRYDDLKNGVDSIVEFEREEGGRSHLALAIDVTDSEIAVAEKFSRIKNSIDAEELSTIKYFRSKDFRGELSLVPRVVVGAGREMIASIADLLLRFQRLRETIARSRKAEEPSPADQNAAREIAAVRQKIAAHPLQGAIILEIRQELIAFEQYANKTGKHKMANRYKDILSLVEELAAEKADVLKSEELLADPVYQMTLDQAKRFGQ